MTAPAPASRPSRLAARAFWLTIAVLALAMLALTLVANWRASPPIPPQEARTRVERALSAAPRSAAEDAQARIGPLLDAAYAPVYAAIPAYADFHYSVLGEYTELTDAVMGRMAEGIEARLFGDHRQRMQDTASTLRAAFGQGYRASLERDIAGTGTVAGGAGQRQLAALAALRDRAVEDATARMQATLPVAGAASALVGSGATKAAAVALGKKLAAKVAAKAAGKTVAKGGGALAGAGTGAISCSVVGRSARSCAGSRVASSPGSRPTPRSSRWTNISTATSSRPSCAP